MSESSVDDAAVPSDVSTQTNPDDDVFSVPTVVVDRVRNAVFRFVVLAVANDPYVVEEFVNVWRAVHVLAFPRLSETVLAVPPL